MAKIIIENIDGRLGLMVQSRNYPNGAGFGVSDELRDLLVKELALALGGLLASDNDPVFLDAITMLNISHLKK